ncbi:GFA family protein [Saccharospirillum mangrovi]|uniref:GFA family protein n=1 Tax=Saccharospirillum mangrovi TaxID=2161747 RepID=UPI0018E5418B|nr:GFA family protein [Saccharospirillum mangrovi]
MDTRFPIEGGCTCGQVRYRLNTEPMIVHCCHCTWCQRETGTAFALNAMIEFDRLESLGIAPQVVHTPSLSGYGQDIARCPHCHVAVWSHYAGSGTLTCFVRVGTLDDAQQLPPDVHIFTSTKQPWVVLPESTPAFEAYYNRDEVWRAESLARFQQLKPAIKAYLASRDSNN